MLEIKNAKKYYNRGKLNEVRAVNNTTIKFPDKGLVTLLGQSGSGKSTLLFTLSGMEALDIGEVSVKDKLIKRYSDKKWSDVRNQDIGYVFQMFNLFENMTVFENIKIVLDLIGIKDVKEVHKRVDIALESVMMRNFKDRRVSTLSGGQQQRVGIARALAKNPKIIIADEPTGNLDSKNSADVLDLLAKIAENSLVVLVTHDIDLAKAYSNRIIYIADGEVVNDVENTPESFTFKEDNVLYLKDYEKDEVTNSSNVSVMTYKLEHERKMDSGNLDLKLIYKKDSLYLSAENNTRHKIRFIDNDSDITLKDAHFEEVEREVNKIDFSTFSEASNKIGNLFTFIKEFKGTLFDIFKAFKSKSFKYIPLLFAGVLIGASVSYLDSTQNKNEINYMSRDQEYVEVVSNDALRLDEISKIENLDSVNYFNPLEEVKISFNDKLTTITTNNYTPFNVRVSGISTLDSSMRCLADNIDINNIARDKIIIDQMLIDKMEMYPKSPFKRIAGYDCSSIIGSTISFKYGELEYEIVGVRNRTAPQVYINESEFYFLSLNIRNAQELEDENLKNSNEYSYTSMQYFNEGEYESLNGISIRRDSQAIFPYKFKTKYGWEIGDVYNGYTIINFYLPITEEHRKSETPIIIISEEKLKNIFYYYPQVSGNTQILKYLGDKVEDNLYYYYFNTNNYETAIKEIDNLNIDRGYGVGPKLTSNHLYQKEKENFSPMSIEIYLFMVVSLAIGIGTFYLLIRSDLMAKIRQISIYKALGVRNSAIYYRYIFRTITLTILLTLPPFIIGLIVTYNLQASITNSIVFNYSYLFMIMGIIFVFIINIFFTLLPVRGILKYSPAELIKHYDI